MIIVRFLRNSPPYMAGEVAGFLDDLAKKLVARGAAEIKQESGMQALADGSLSQEIHGTGAGEALPPIASLPKRGRRPSNQAGELSTVAIDH